MGKVLRHRITDIVREQRADKRKVNHLTDSLEKPTGTGEGDGTFEGTLFDKIAEHVVNRVDLYMDLERAMNTLTLRQQRLCSLLSRGDTASGVAKQLGVSRSTVHDDIARIRSIFQDHQLSDYLD